MFPIFDVHNRVIGFGGRVLGDTNPKYLNSPETKLFDKSKNLYGLNIARTSREKYIMIVEGYMDVISLHQYGFSNTVASLGTALTSSQANLLRRYTDEVVLAYDSDEAGVKAALRAIPILEGVGCTVRVIRIPTYKDPDEYIKNKGKESFYEIISQAKPGFLFELEELEKQYQLGDPDQRTKFYQNIAERLVKIDNEIKRESYLETVLDHYRIKPNAMLAEMEKIGKDVGIVHHMQSPPIETRAHHKSKSRNSIEGAQKNILTFIISHRDIFDAISSYVFPYEFIDDTYRKVAEIIFSLYENDKEIQPAMIINQFVELEEQNKVASIFNNNIKLNHSSQFEKMINESIRILKNAYIDKKSRNITDVSELQELIGKKREIQRLYISLNHG